MPRIGEITARRVYVFQKIFDAKRSDEVTGRCSRCRHHLRWAFLLRNTLSGDLIEVGCCCAKLLCNSDCDALETEAKNCEARLQAFLDEARWTISPNGNPTRLIGKPKKRGWRTRVTVFQSHYGDWSFRLRDKQGGWYPTMKEAQIAAFQVWEEMR